MGWSLVRISDLPLNSRTLRFGSQGKDVAELQELLRLAGFYFGEKDGSFGLLTEEAVVLLQKTFNLRVDGVAGKEVFHVLGKVVRKTGRIIYAVKKNENLQTISEKYGVGKTAWRAIPGQGNPYTKIYPGMKVLLHQKAFFCWEVMTNEFAPIPVSGFIKEDINIEPDGGLNFTAPDRNVFHLIGATGETWTELLSSPKGWDKLAREIKKIDFLKYGIDLRSAPPDKINGWLRFLKYISKNLNRNELLFIVLPFYPRVKGHEKRLYWLNLPKLSGLAKFLMLEPVFLFDSPVQFEASANQLIKDLRQIARQGFINKTLLINLAGAWDWNLSQGTYEEITYKEAKLIRAQNFRTAKYCSGSKFTSLHYFKRNEPHCLIYRDQEGWLEMLEIIIKMNLLGIVIRKFNDLGKMGPEIIMGSFSVLPENTFQK